jgi:hypothetical protein
MGCRWGELFHAPGQAVSILAVVRGGDFHHRNRDSALMRGLQGIISRVIMRLECILAWAINDMHRYEW